MTGLYLLSFLLLLLGYSAAFNIHAFNKVNTRHRFISTSLFGSGAIMECSDESCNFEEAVVKESQKGFVVVDFYADWCGPCKIAAKTFAAIAEEFPDKSVKFVKVNTESHEDTVDVYGLKGLPVFGIFKNGQLVKKHEGNIGKDKLLDFIVTGLKA